MPEAIWSWRYSHLFPKLLISCSDNLLTWKVSRPQICTLTSENYKIKNQLTLSQSIWLI